MKQALSRFALVVLSGVSIVGGCDNSAGKVAPFKPIPTIQPVPEPKFPSKNATGGAKGRILRAVSQLSGPKAIDCGSTTLNNKDRAAAEACGIRAFKARKPFRLHYSITDRSNSYHWGMAGNAKGQVFILNAEETLTHDDNEASVNEELYACKKPGIDTYNGLPRVDCLEKPLIPHKMY